MPYVYSNVDDLDGKPPVGSKSCVALVQHYAKVPHTSSWKEGVLVKGNKNISKGTAIATFVDGKYSNKTHGNHAAFYISQDASGIWVMDQWSTKQTISKRRVIFRGKNKKGEFIDPSNNGDAFSIIK